MRCKCCNKPLSDRELRTCEATDFMCAGCLSHVAHDLLSTTGMTDSLAVSLLYIEEEL